MITNKSLKINWLGQGGFLIETPTDRIVVDPYLSDALAVRGLPRMFPPPYSIQQLMPSLIAITHDHADHFDEQTMIPLCKAFPKSLVIGPSSVESHYRRLDMNINQFRTVNVGDVFYKGNLSIRAVKAFHTDAFSEGFLLNYQDFTIYISGDTTFEDSFLSCLDAVKEKHLNVLIICINGKLGNMDWKQALKVAEYLKPDKVIPMHYGLFADNTVDPHPFASEVKNLGMKCSLLEPGVSEILI